ncbi:hypothetical protein NP493_11g12020 [Ridgeia piscesae]|uniref:Uncharacterized protein n=1 Tax=Ridgeia piscesae TaxID=27915 RepID=A0AAD9UL91_RIDPI|nr:hypothetical protein NP493_11g12020 [Ridgeia piscesae]
MLKSQMAARSHRRLVAFRPANEILMSTRKETERIEFGRVRV